MTAPTSPPHTPPAAAQNPRPGNFAWIAVLLTLTGLSLAAFLTLRASAPAKDSPIHIAAKTNDVATLKQLLAADPNLANAKTEGMGATPLHWAAAAGKLEAVRVLLEYHANPNLVHKIGGTALHAAVRYNHGPVVEYLLDHGANLNGRDAGGRTALFLAVFEKKPEMVKILLQRQADTTIPDHEWVTPLQMARITQNKVMIDLLTAAGATQ